MGKEGELAELWLQEDKQKKKPWELKSAILIFFFLLELNNFIRTLTLNFISNDYISFLQYLV